MRLRAFAAMAALALLLAGCAASANRVQPYLEDLERIFTLKDQVSQQYVEALAAAQAYTADPAPQTLASAKETCLAAIAAITDAPGVTSALTEEQRQAMGELGMDPADYMTPFMMESYERGTRLQTLTDVLRYLNQAPLSNDALAMTAEIDTDFEGLSWQLDLTGLNHLLAELSEAEIRDFRDSFLMGLSSPEGTDIPWERDREALEARSEEIFAAMEALVSRHAAEVGALYSAFLEEASPPGAALEDAGLPAEEAGRLAEEMDKYLTGQGVG